MEEPDEKVGEIVKEDMFEEFDKLAELSWNDMLYEIISTLDPWDINLIELASRYSKKVDEMQKIDFHIPANVMLISSILLRMKADVLHFSDLDDKDELGYENSDYADYGDYDSEFNNNLDDFEVPIILKPRRVPKRKVTAMELIAAIHAVLEEKTREIKKKIAIKTRDMIIPLEPDIKKLIEEIYNRVLDILNNRGDKVVTFSEITGEHKEQGDRIRIFLSILHLSNKQKLKISQKKMFEEIFIRGV